MRPGVGQWCYEAVGQTTISQKQDFVSAVVDGAKRAQATYSVPGPILAAMAIHESGYGRTRLAILSNNLLSFKKPASVAWQFGRPTFVLWCQPAVDRGNEYLLFGSTQAALDYVAKVLATRLDLPYARITEGYRRALAAGMDRKAAGRAWLGAVAASYAGDPNYPRNVMRYLDNPVQPGSGAAPGRSLWDLVP